MEKVPLPFQVCWVPLGNERIRMSSLSGHEVPCELKSIVPLLLTLPQSSKVPTPCQRQVAPGRTVTTSPFPLQVKFEGKAALPKSKTPAVTSRVATWSLLAPFVASSETTLFGSVPVLLILRLLKVVELLPLMVWFEVPLKVTVNVPALNVPLLIQLPPLLMSAPGHKWSPTRSPRQW